MRFMHLADLHIGKKVNGFSMLKDQRFVLEQVLEIARSQRLDGVILAGDIYDKSLPAGEAVQLLDWFLTEMVNLGLEVYMVSGNHDSVERLSFGSKLFVKSGLHVMSVYDGQLKPIVLKDEYGFLNMYLLPFVKPAHVRNAMKKRLTEKNGLNWMNEMQAETGQKILEDRLEPATEMEEAVSYIKTYEDAIVEVLKEAAPDANARNLLVAHQFVTGAERCDSEDISVGGMDNVSADLFDDFDYVALGHIHGPQSMKRETIRYAGTLLKYSFSECAHKKSVTIVELKEKGNVKLEVIPIEPLHDMRIIEGDYQTIMSRAFYEGTNCKDYLKIVLTDEQEIPEVMGKLRTVYPNIMGLEYNNIRTRHSSSIDGAECGKSKQPIEYFRDFYEKQNGTSLSEQQEKLAMDAIREIWG